MKIKKNIALSDSGFVFNPSTGESFSVNPIGVEILQLLREGKDKDHIKATITEQYQIDEATFERDFDDFTNMMKHYLLTETDG
ncbi:MAG: PqqD family protein [Bacteroidota bacterium]